MRKFVILLCALLVITAAGCKQESSGIELPVHENTAVTVSITDKAEYADYILEIFGSYADTAAILSSEFESKTYCGGFYEPAMKALDDMEAVTPPDELKELHQRLCGGINDEREYNRLMLEMEERLKNGETDSDRLKEIDRRLEELENQGTFFEALHDIILMKSESKE